MFSFVAATPAERRATMPGDDLLPRPDVVIDRAFTVAAAPAAVWPWIVQLGKGRAGWYLPPTVERLLPQRYRATRRIEPHWQQLTAGDVVPDYGRNATFEVVAVEPARSLVYRSQRGAVRLTWAIVLDERPNGTRIRLRLALDPVRRQRLARILGDGFDAATIAGMAAGLRDRV